MTVTHINGHEAEDTGRMPPHDIPAEMAVLGAMLLSADAASECLVALSADQFFRGGHQIIFETIAAMADAGQPADPVTVKAELERRGLLGKITGAPYLLDLIAAVPSAANAGYYARTVRRTAVRRRALEVGTRIVNLAYSGDGEAEELANLAVHEAETICPVREDRGIRLAGRLFEDVVAGLERADARGLPLPWEDLNEALTGLAPGELIVVAGRPGAGKSIVGGQIAAWTATQLHAPVLLCSLEMSAEEIMLRLIAAEARVPLSALIKRRLDDGDWDRIRRAYEQFSEAPLAVDDSAGTTLVHIRSRLRAMRRTGAAQLLVVDYLQLLSGPESESRQQSVAALSTGLKRIAREFAIPVVVVAALNRNSEHRNDKRPMAADLRDSGQQEADADVIILLHREEMYDPGTADRGVVELIIAKNRQGPRCSVTLGFQGDYGRCVGLAKEDQWQT